MSGTCDGRGGIEGREHGEERRRTGGSRRAVAADAGPDVEHERLDGDDVVVVGGDGGGERADVRADVEEEAAVARVQVAHDARDDVPLPASLLRHVRRHLRTRLDDARGRDGAGFGTRSGMVWTAMSNAFAVHVFLTNLEATEPSSGSAHDTGWAPAARASVDAAMISTMPAFMIGARASLLGGVDGREMRGSRRLVETITTSRESGRAWTCADDAESSDQVGDDGACPQAIAVHRRPDGERSTNGPPDGRDTYVHR